MNNQTHQTIEKLLKTAKRTLHSGLFWTIAGVVVAVATLLLAINWHSEDASATDAKNSQAAQATAIGVSQNWGQSNQGCGLEQLAFFAPVQKVTPERSPNGGFSDLPAEAQMWHRGELDLIVTTGGTASYTVTGMKVTDYKALSDTPAWYYQRGFGGCGGGGDKSVHLQLDGDTGILHRLSPNGRVDISAGIDKNSLFDPISVTADSTASFKLYARACRQNSAFSITVDYQTAGQSQISEKTIGPFQLYASNLDSPLFVDDPSRGITQSDWNSTNLSSDTLPCS
ncbi:hypothetical protein [Arthrobacter sp. efr-133-TYG-120]|uniref:hypothetical protein n=1 Tax=Arthrobacter sp. efr-133-TYG-120 TaxID=3040280 RepID=UPI00254AC530|nr:hypothetical protein [Arthrobacter sp. efr-133-TYG-120]